MFGDRIGVCYEGPAAPVIVGALAGGGAAGATIGTSAILGGAAIGATVGGAVAAGKAGREQQRIADRQTAQAEAEAVRIQQAQAQARAAQQAEARRIAAQQRRIAQANASAVRAEFGEVQRGATEEQTQRMALSRARAGASGAGTGGSPEQFMQEQERSFRADLDWLRRASASQQSIALEGGQAASLQTLASARQAFAQNLFQTRAAVTGLRQTAGAAQAAGAAAQANVIGAISGAIGTTANIYGAGQQSGWWGG